MWLFFSSAVDPENWPEGGSPHSEAGGAVTES
jgi:hypothetical protein